MTHLMSTHIPLVTAEHMAETKICGTKKYTLSRMHLDKDGEGRKNCEKLV